MHRDKLANTFEQNRVHLQGVAYRMLGSLSEAEDAVQETWLRLSRADTTLVGNLAGWLTTVTARVCLRQSTWWELPRTWRRSRWLCCPSEPRGPTGQRVGKAWKGCRSTAAARGIQGATRSSRRVSGRPAVTRSYPPGHSSLSVPNSRSIQAA